MPETATDPELFFARSAALRVRCPKRVGAPSAGHPRRTGDDARGGSALSDRAGASNGPANGRARAGHGPSGRPPGRSRSGAVVGEPGRDLVDVSAECAHGYGCL